ncbi:hypothetical protein IF128_12820 [Empedobacter stercoris]|uniref:hypothetical protein n=1 Tax=Empedobacter stercoris TaxID=1628248 RepID=UPI001CE1AF2B|nr:hypothetical protein [Empedobacter stercoris]MCA4810612.1 hypothetical protein [Empedobacter stercoris]
MNKIFLLFTILFSTCTYSQILSYNDIKSILDQSLIEADNTLSNKGYRINRNSGIDENSLSYIWDKKGKSDRSTSYLIISIDKSRPYKMVWYQFHSLSHYNSLLKTIESLNFKRTESYYKFESLNSIYENDTYNISISKAANHYTFSIRYQFNKLLLKEIKPKF